MRSEKSKKGSKNNKAKRNVQTVKKAPGRHSKEEIISKEELENRIAISGDIRLLSHHAFENLYRWIFPPS